MVLGNWKKANDSMVFKKGKKEDLGNSRPVSLSLILGTMMEQILLETFSKHMKVKKVIGSSQHGILREKSCLTSLIAF